VVCPRASEPIASFPVSVEGGCILVGGIPGPSPRRIHMPDMSPLVRPPPRLGNFLVEALAGELAPGASSTRRGLGSSALQG